MSPQNADTLFKSLGGPTRRRLFEYWRLDGEQNVWTLTNRASISKPAVSKHLVVIKGAGLVTDEQRNCETHYTA